jgi:histidinol-phosphate phosphatase family protein
MILPSISKSWTLFLDRDGVINRRLPGAYVCSWAAFEWLPGTLDALVYFAGAFGRIVVVTNQQGIGKGLMSEADIRIIHRLMRQEAEAAGGRIDGVYYCPSLSSAQPNCRKPAPDMALQAQRDFPEIDFSRSLMVGDSLSDMAFGQGLGMLNVLVATKTDEAAALATAQAEGLRWEGQVGSLYELAQVLRGGRI